MSDEEHRFTPAGDYATFLNGLAGLIDDADVAGYDPAAVKVLAEALKHFRREFLVLHQDYGAAKAPRAESEQPE